MLALSAALVVADHGTFVWWRFVLEDVGLGLAFGIAVGFAAALLLPRGEYARETVAAGAGGLLAARIERDAPAAGYRADPGSPEIPSR